MSLALAGPTWKQKPVPVWQPQVPLVILFDVSRSMDATDLKPDRIRRARYKLQDLFQARRGTPMALVAFSAQPFVLAPLSNDIDTLNHLAASLATDLVPVQGSRLDRALEKARTMIQQSGFQDGDILLLTDDHRASNPALQQAMSIAESGLRLSVLSVGSAEGAPIPGKEGFIRNATGQMILTSPNEDFHQQLARTGNGQWVRMSTNNQDIQTLAAGFHRPNMDNAQLSDLSINQWYDYGPWLLPPLLLLAALMFRRGLVFIVPLLIMPYPPAQAMEWNELWQNPNQRGYEAFQQGDFDEASNHFNDSRWRASALYRAGQYEQALKALGEPVTADDWYNQANMLAKTGRIPEAIAAYDQALELKPDHEDARYNKSLLEQQQEQQQTEQNQDQEQQQSSNENQQQSDQNEGESSTEDEQSAQNSKDDESPEDQQARESGEPSEQEQDSQSDESAKPEESEPGATAKDEIPMQADQNKESTDQGSSMGQSAINEEQAADEAWLRQIPDDPASLMQRMFQYEAMKNRYRSEKEAW
jgi:Ca-activated chloride channel family protein